MAGNSSDWSDDDDYAEDYDSFSALNFSTTSTAPARKSDLPASGAQVPPGTADAGSSGEAVNPQNPDSEGGTAVDVFTVTNPPATVSVSVRLDGRIHKVELKSEAKRMRESDLAGEIMAVADLAWQKGLAAQHSFMSEVLRRIGGRDEVSIGEFVEDGMGLPSPAQADAAQAEVFATRYATHHD